MPTHLSACARDMLTRILNTDPKNRITIDGIREHEFYKLHPAPIQTTENTGLMIGYNRIPLDNYIMSLLEKYDINAESARKNLDANRHNHMTTTYYLLLNKCTKSGRRHVIEPHSNIQSIPDVKNEIIEYFRIIKEIQKLKYINLLVKKF
jgi:5'-AMP-activated protein kinase, catalytic alpha subunit